MWQSLSGCSSHSCWRVAFLYSPICESFHNRALPILSNCFFAEKMKGGVKCSGWGSSAATGSFWFFPGVVVPVDAGDCQFSLEDEHS